MGIVSVGQRRVGNGSKDEEEAGSPHYYERMQR